MNPRLGPAFMTTWQATEVGREGELKAVERRLAYPASWIAVLRALDDAERKRLVDDWRKWIRERPAALIRQTIPAAGAAKLLALTPTRLSQLVREHRLRSTKIGRGPHDLPGGFFSLEVDGRDMVLISLPDVAFLAGERIAELRAALTAAGKRERQLAADLRRARGLACDRCNRKPQPFDECPACRGELRFPPS
jgi:hypothetical protein